MNWACFVDYVEKFQTLIAGMVAIAAAGIAYLGALKQARAVVDAEQHRMLEQRRAVAGALWAELASVGTRLFADAQRLRSTRVRDGRLLDLTPLDISVFAANLSALGTLPPDDALVVTQVYKLIIDLNTVYAKVSSSPGTDDQWASSIGHYVESVVQQVRVTLGGLRETAGMPEDKAAAAMSPWSPAPRG